MKKLIMAAVAASALVAGVAMASYQVKVSDNSSYPDVAIAGASCTQVGNYTVACTVNANPGQGSLMVRITKEGQTFNCNLDETDAALVQNSYLLQTQNGQTNPGIEYQSLAKGIMAEFGLSKNAKEIPADYCEHVQ